MNLTAENLTHSTDNQTQTTVPNAKRIIHIIIYAIFIGGSCCRPNFTQIEASKAQTAQKIQHCMPILLIFGSVR